MLDVRELVAKEGGGYLVSADSRASFLDTTSRARRPREDLRYQVFQLPPSLAPSAKLPRGRHKLGVHVSLRYPTFSELLPSSTEILSLRICIMTGACLVLLYMWCAGGSAGLRIMSCWRRLDMYAGGFQSFHCPKEIVTNSLSPNLPKHSLSSLRIAPPNVTILSK